MYGLVFTTIIFMRTGLVPYRGEETTGERERRESE
jgi:hypothetical protein